MVKEWGECFIKRSNWALLKTIKQISHGEQWNCTNLLKWSYNNI